MTTDIDVFCAGIACWDMAFSIQANPGPDQKTLSKHLQQGGGGPATTAAGTAASLGGKVTLATYLGNDWAGEAVLEQLNKRGVPGDSIFWVPMQTPLSAILVKPDGLRTIVTHKQAEPEVALDILDDTLRRSRFLLVDPHWPRLAQHLVERARSLGIPSMVDAGSVNKASVQLAGMVDYCVCSEQFAKDKSGVEDPETMLNSLRSQYRNLIITLGVKGCVWSVHGQTGSTPACPATVVDTTGAGDIFHGALALSLAGNATIPEATAFASKAAAIGCSRPGSLSAVPRKDEI